MTLSTVNRRLDRCVLGCVLLDGASKLAAAFGDAPDEVIEGAFSPEMLAALKATRAAIRKATGATGREGR